jgi:UDP-N-acetyl-2-amino-2-deoxyglucuronate dehydrogenase
MKNFALIGAAGYIAPRHMKAIKETGNNLLAALDINDSIGIIDSYFPTAEYFKEYELFDNFLLSYNRTNKTNKIEFVSICSPNYLHQSHIASALRFGANVICEKPLVLTPRSLDELRLLEDETNMKVYSVLQLRLHDAIRELKSRVLNSSNDKSFDIDLTYITSRGKWYQKSWKGDNSKSGGLITNIGVHFFDMLYYVFGKIQKNILHYRDISKASGFIEFERARVRWFLSIDESDLPEASVQNNQTTFRSLLINDEFFNFTEGFTDLHTKVYEDILIGNGFGLEDNKIAIQCVYDLRHLHPIGLTGDYHPYLKEIKK